MDPSTFNTCLTKICEGSWNEAQNLHQYFTYQSGKGIAEVDKRCQDSFAHFLAAHNQSNPYASYFLGTHYACGWGVALDKAKALEITQLVLSRLRHPWHLWRLANYTNEGIAGKLEADQKKAAALYEESAKLDFAPAEYDYGLLLLEGKVMKRDLKMATALMESGARKGSWYACIEHGLRLINIVNNRSEKDILKGITTILIKQDTSKGLELLRLAKDLGGIDAAYQLGYQLKYHADGDRMEIQSIFEKAAKYFHPLALHEVCFLGYDNHFFGVPSLSPFKHYFPKTNPLYFRYGWRNNIYPTISAPNEIESCTLRLEYVGPGTVGPLQIAKKDILPKIGAGWATYYAKEMAILIREADERIQRELQAKAQPVAQLPVQPANSASPNITINANGTSTLTMTVSLSELPALLEKLKIGDSIQIINHQNNDNS